MPTTKDLMEAILKTASVNIENNLDDAYADLEEVYDMAEQYTSQYASCITRDIMMVQDRNELMSALRMQALGSFYMFRVLTDYIHKLEVINEVEGEESLNEIISD